MRTTKIQTLGWVTGREIGACIVEAQREIGHLKADYRERGWLQHLSEPWDWMAHLSQGRAVRITLEEVE